MRFNAAGIVSMMVFSIFIWIYVLNTAWTVAREFLAIVFWPILSIGVRRREHGGIESTQFRCHRVLSLLLEEG